MSRGIVVAIKALSNLALGWVSLAGLESGITIAQSVQDDRAVDPAAIEFFESRIRPVLVEHCYECHNSHGTSEGGLVLDHRQAMLNGGDGGPILDLEHPAESRLLKSIKHEIEGYEMPAGRPKLADDIAADFERWLAKGAVDPRGEPPTAEEHTAMTSWPEIRQKRQAWWAFQPILRPELPLGTNERHPIDAFIDARLATLDLSPAPPADIAVLVRRLFVVLIGLPPTAEQAEYWGQQLQQASTSDRQREYERLVDELLASPQFGERWARHWMDWIRYAETHGSEGDPTIVNAHHYRDYLIRSWNQDVPYDQLVREHVAGDLLENPRINPNLGFNESRLGTAHWRMVFHGFSPTDALDEQVRFIDDQINVFSKAFLGLTVSCARCHDHKFDPIGQDDYYALYGIMRSNRAARHVINQTSGLPEQLAELTQLKTEIRSAVAADWLADQGPLRQRLQEVSQREPAEAANALGFGMLVRAAHAERQGKSVAETWREERQVWLEYLQATVAEQASSTEVSQWLANSPELPTTRQAAGQFAVATEEPRALVGIYPAGIYSHGLSAKLAARLTSKDIDLKSPQDLWLQVIGDREASLRYAVRDYPRDGTIYPIQRLNGQTWSWQRFDLAYWTGDLIHIELAHAQDAPLLVAGQERSWFGIRSARLVPAGTAAPGTTDEANGAIFDLAGDRTPQSLADLVELYHEALWRSIESWRTGNTTDPQAMLLDAALRQGLLINQTERLPSAKALVQTYQALEREIQTPLRVPGLVEADIVDQPLYVRGDHRRPGEVVPRRFLAAIDPTPYVRADSGRRQLAEDLLRSDNPLTRRVIVNRLWHHLFGRGLVATPDNFGKLGSEPTHPELLDWLADDFVSVQQWSLKKMIRRIVTSETWQRDSTASPTARQRDPDQVYLASFPLRRFEAETVRDALLHAAGVLNLELFGPGETNVLHTRRSIYSAVRRNSLDPFLRLFDFPEPSTSVGRRDVTTVPAQSLTMLNDPLVRHAADQLAQRLVTKSEAMDQHRALIELYWRCFGRAPTEREVELALGYLGEIRFAQDQLQAQWSAVQQRQAELTENLNAILEPIRERLTGRARGAGASLGLDIVPVARWNFLQGTNDLVGAGHGALEGSAQVRDGALVLDGNGYLVSAPLSQEFTAKTFEAWVQLEDLNQQGGGVISLQTKDGNQFDSLVFGEQQPGHWLAGSDVFSRTQNLVGPVETEAAAAVVHVALAYHPDGMIHAYRQGQPYGTPYRSGGPLRFAANEAVVTIGLRHLPSGGNRLLRGQVFEARLYDRSLNDSEIIASYQQGIDMVTLPQLLAELQPQQRAQVEAWQTELLELQQRGQALMPNVQELEPAAAWSELVQAMLMSVEFVTIR